MNSPLRQRLLMSVVVIAAILVYASGNERREEEGKKDATEEDKKRSWSKTGLRVWGKRDDEGEEEKRKWGDNKVRVWGKRDLEDEKRAWDKNNLRAWGKRDWDKTELEGEDETAKRTWSNRVRAWGKRSDDDVNHDEKSPLKTEAKMADHSSTEHRSAIVKQAIESRVKLSWNSNVGGFTKRVEYYPPDVPKRIWRTPVRAWGKRNAV